MITYLNQIIQWCNDNAGFTSAILSVMTILLSIIAIVVSIETAKIPYRKNMAIIIYGLCDGHEEYELPIMVINNGNRPICIYSIEVKIDGRTNLIMQHTELNDTHIINSVSTQKLCLPIWQNSQNPFDAENFEAKVIITDVEGKKYISTQKIPGRNKKYDTFVAASPEVKKPVIFHKKNNKKKKKHR